MNDDYNDSSSEAILAKLEELGESFDKTIERVLSLAEKQTELHFKERERENKRRMIKTIICCIIMCCAFVIYQSIYLSYNSETNRLYFSKVKDQGTKIEELEERMTNYEKSSK